MFNKKEIKQLRGEVNELRNDFFLLAEKVKKETEKQKEPKCFEVGDGTCIPENTYLSYFGKCLKAIEDYLKIKIVWEWEDDPNFPPQEPRKRRVWRAIKKTKTPPLK